MKRDEAKRRGELLASYGADPARWPAAEQKLASGMTGGEAENAAEAGKIDRLLDLATRPALPPGAESRLMQHIAASPGRAPVVVLRPAPLKLRRTLQWLAALPLAASLALGVYLGAEGSLDAFLPSAITGSLASAEDDAGDLTGLDDAEVYAEENLT